MNLETCMRREYALSKRYWTAMTVSQGIGLASAIYSVLAERYLLLAGGLVIVTVLTSFLLRLRGGVRQSKGDRVRRLLLLKEGLGKEPPARQLAEIEVDSPGLPPMEPAPQAGYYGSDMKPGPRRLAHILSESAFHTRWSAGVAGSLFLAVATGGVLASVALLWIFATGSLTEPGSSREVPGGLVVRIVAVLFPFFAVGTYAQMALSFRALSEVARGTFTAADELRKRDSFDLADLLPTLIEYDCACAKAPPIPGLAYVIGRSRRNKAWADHMKGSPTTLRDAAR